MHTSKLSALTDTELQTLIDRARRELAERHRRQRHGSKYVLDSQMIDGVRWTKELIPCGNSKCKRCREKGEFHGPYFKRWTYTDGRMKPSKPQREEPTGWRQKDKE